jgi:hypothetical protein
VPVRRAEAKSLRERAAPARPESGGFLGRPGRAVFAGRAGRGRAASQARRFALGGMYHTWGGWAEARPLGSGWPGRPGTKVRCGPLLLRRPEAEGALVLQEGCPPGPAELPCWPTDRAVAVPARHPRRWRAPGRFGGGAVARPGARGSMKALSLCAAGAAGAPRLPQTRRGVRTVASARRRRAVAVIAESCRPPPVRAPALSFFCLAPVRASGPASPAGEMLRDVRRGREGFRVRTVGMLIDQGSAGSQAPSCSGGGKLDGGRAGPAPGDRAAVI